jgi:hypothetical protein
MKPVSVKDMGDLAAIVRDADAFLADVEKQTGPLDPDVLQLRDEVRGLRVSVARVLAVAGLDPSWARTPQRMELGPEDSAFVRGLLQNTREPSETLRRAAEDYKSFVGL